MKHYVITNEDGNQFVTEDGLFADIADPAEDVMIFNSYQEASDCIAGDEMMKSYHIKELSEV